MASLTRFIEGVGCGSTRQKSAVARPGQRSFLGFTVTDDRSRRRIADKALAFKDRVRDLTRRDRGVSLSDDLRPDRLLRGWAGYFGFSQMHESDIAGRLDTAAPALRRLGPVEDRAQPLSRTSSPEGHREGRPARPSSAEGTLAHVRSSGGASCLQQPPLRFDLVSPDSMFRQLNPLEPPWYVTRMPGGVGGAAS